MLPLQILAEQPAYGHPAYISLLQMTSLRVQSIEQPMKNSMLAPLSVLVLSFAALSSVFDFVFFSWFNEYDIIGASNWVVRDECMGRAHTIAPHPTRRSLIMLNAPPLSKAPASMQCCACVPMLAPVHWCTHQSRHHCFTSCHLSGARNSCNPS